MILDEVVGWYQKKIGTYDKQQWEKSVEQKILDGLSTVTLNKTAKLKTDLIDVDLVRGSTFPKAKPKQSLFTVIRLAILRYVFFPAYARWWVRQTSPNTFVVLLFLYITQMVNWAVYSLNVHHLEKMALQISNFTITIENQENDLTASDTRETKSKNNLTAALSDLLLPMALSFLLSLIHSQIVATNIVTGAKVKRKRFSNTSQNDVKPREQKIRRCRRILKLPTQEARQENPKDLQQNEDRATADKMITTKSNSDISQPPCSSAIYYLNKTSTTSNIKKRNVNWFSPQDKEARGQYKKASLPYELSSDLCLENQFLLKQHNWLLNGNSKNTLTNITDEKCVQEFIDDLINLTVLTSEIKNEPSKYLTQNAKPRQTKSDNKRNIEDDGFESFNGKSSSGEETNLCTPSNLSIKNQRRGVKNAYMQNKTRNFQEPETCHKVVSLVPETDDEENHSSIGIKKFQSKQKTKIDRLRESSDETDEGLETTAKPISLNSNFNYNECTTSATEWLGVTTNSEEECSYSSELDNTTDFKNHHFSDEDRYDLDFIPTTILNAHGSIDRISCTIWDKREFKKAQMSVLEISHVIIDRVESMPETYDYIYIGMCFSFLLTLIPPFCRLCEVAVDYSKDNEMNYLDFPMLLWQKASFSFSTIFYFAFGKTQWERTVLIISFIQRFFLTTILFIIFAAAEKTFKQRFLYAKLFSHLTSLRRARKSNLPHFRLNKVRNIKTWLSVRSYLKKRGPQRSVDVIVSAAFFVTLSLLAFLSIGWLQDSTHLQSHLNFEALMWSTTIGIFLLRYMTLGNKIHQKYRSISVLITEQINLYLQIEQKPKKKDELMVSNSVLKLAADLIKELESPFKISGLSANPYLFTTIKVVILSALSGILSEMLGFKLKLHKIKIK